ncbi:alpha/beta hydrolase [Actinophytocola xinjiangensis]|uniref:Alpha/beta hydrolase n=1 Tax=Actinophytocola xinjiangensis TaxID=485602 RepID=A0A7Z0WF05_9PSEU|nr:alpha/beta hydrolase [Actinophytocola xinjiangensis]OLF05360.1 alpha/beta hydrolase [Actinophytocola xinjiangensis]
MTSYLTSADGTRIAYESTGSGPALILVDGAMCYRDSGPARPLAAELADSFTVYLYDRRGRGESDAGSEISIEREVEDLAALAKEAGGSPYLYGISSGAVLAADAAARGIGTPRLAIYEPPLIVDDRDREPLPADSLERITSLVDSGRNGDAVKSFMRAVQVPGFAIAMMRLMPAWSRLKAVAPTLRYDFTLMRGLQQGNRPPADRWSTATMPTLVIDGGKSSGWMRTGVEAMAKAMPNATYRTLPGQNHMVKPAALAPVLKEFYTA